jgi:predicted dehydrogenase
VAAEGQPTKEIAFTAATAFLGGMAQKADGMNYAPQGKARPVVKPGEFVFAAAFLEHGHIYGQCNGLLEAGAELKWVYDADPKKVEAFLAKCPQAKVARSFDEILADPAVKLVAAAAVPSERGAIGGRVMRAGKDYFTDKTPFTALDQLATARQVVAETGRKYMVYYSERLHVECAMHAGDLVHGGAIGRVVQVLGLGPHRIGQKAGRPAWFYERAKYGGILCDIGSHQIEQFLFYSGATDATVSSAAVANFANADTPEFEDFGEASLAGDNGTAIISAWTGSRRPASAPGATAARSSLAPKATSSSANTWMWRGRRRATSSTWWTTRASSTSIWRAKSASAFSANSSSTA